MPSYRIREAADLLGVSDDSLRRWAESGRLATAVGGSERSEHERMFHHTTSWSLS